VRARRAEPEHEAVERPPGRVVVARRRRRAVAHAAWRVRNDLSDAAVRTTNGLCGLPASRGDSAGPSPNVAGASQHSDFAHRSSFIWKGMLTMKTTKFFVAAALAAGALTAIPAQADEGPFMIRLRAVYLDFAQKSDAFTLNTDTAGAVNIPADAITINKKTIPDIDLEYFFTKNFSSELVLTYPQSQNVTVNVPGLGGVALGTFKHLPPTLTAKWNFIPDGTFRPYVGVGVNLTLISSVNLAVPAVAGVQTTAIPLDLSSSSFGIAGQAGFDVKLADHYFFNVDVKYVQLGADVKAGGATITKVHLDPWLLGAGIGYRF
jgi:outer membrane protein